jgi:hypothetical protein
MSFKLWLLSLLGVKPCQLGALPGDKLHQLQFRDNQQLLFWDM